MANRSTTKYYSCKQENMIAQYLGWDVVSGSGARAFHPGDVRSEVFLGECKTHETKKRRVRVLRSVWDKISAEAMENMRIPVLFFDNGVQTIENTWCIVGRVPSYVSAGDPWGLQISKKSFSFLHKETNDIFDVAKRVYTEQMPACCISDIYLLRIDGFREYML